MNKSVDLKVRPIIILGAARSGTNMLRDILSGLPDFTTWDCDEINPIWRHGNLNIEHDEFDESMARTEVVSFVRKAFNKIGRKGNARFVVEKSCANTLRIPFVKTILPEAKYVVISRSGMDTTASAMLRWTAPFDLSYTIKKARFIPWSDIPYYVLNYGKNRLRQYYSKEKKLSFWGLRLKRMRKLIEEYSLAEICALQWKYAVEKTNKDIQKIDPNSVFKLQYELFVNNPNSVMSELLNFLEVSVDKNTINSLVSGVSNKSIGKHKSQLTSEQIDLTRQIVEGVRIE